MTLRNTWLVVEAALLFIAIPILFAARIVPIHIIPAMMVIAFFADYYLARYRRLHNEAHWSTQRLRYHARPMLGTFICLAPLMVVILWRLEPDYLFLLPRKIPWLWVLIMCCYPLVSVLPQTIIWRGFLLHRYRPVIGEGWFAVAIATAAFSFAHIYFLNIVALIVTAIGGLLFVLTYRRTGSRLLSAAEHALYGCWAFTVGYGRFLYGGTVSVSP